MKFKIPKKLIVGGVDYTIKSLEQVNCGRDFGDWDCLGTIRIAEKSGCSTITEARKRQTLWHELTHAILHQMGEYELCDNERFVNTFSSFLSGAVDSME